MFNDSIGKMSSYNAAYFDHSQPKNKSVLALQKKDNIPVYSQAPSALSENAFVFIHHFCNLAELKATPYLPQSG